MEEPESVCVDESHLRALDLRDRLIQAKEMYGILKEALREYIEFADNKECHSDKSPYETIVSEEEVYAFGCEVCVNRIGADDADIFKGRWPAKYEQLSIIANSGPNTGEEFLNDTVLSWRDAYSWYINSIHNLMDSIVDDE